MPIIGWTNFNYCPIFSISFSMNKEKICRHYFQVSSKEHHWFIVPAKVNNMYSWIELMVVKNLPLTLVNDELFREASCYDPVSSNTLKNYMELLCGKLKMNCEQFSL
jgi:hypothetical protein